ncbi:MAG TPA: SLC13 family permease [Candidatus Hydrogenedentes bacterium]|nr:SLC13 family permease [Candidatus Hydrogenedentota bacterium]
MTEDARASVARRRLDAALLLGAPACGLALMLFVDLEPGAPLVTRTAAITVWMAIWWLTGVVPLAVTALLPLVLFPALGVMPADKTPSYYVNDVIFLFLGGFMVALAMERWNLHRRIALAMLVFFGVHPRRMLLGFMAPTFFLSMWISNTATTMMIVPIAMAMIVRFEQTHNDPAFKRYAVGLLLGIAYSASIGGVATLIGTPPNLAFTRIFAEMFPQAPEISFLTWFLFGAPLALVLLAALWGLLVMIFCPSRERFHIDPGVVRDQYRALGPMNYEERAVATVFALMAVLWLTRPGIAIGGLSIPGWAGAFPYPEYLRDGVVAIAMAIILFMLPSRGESGKRIMDWAATRDLPWDIVLLLGGGFALAAGFQASGLSVWVGERLAGLADLNPAGMVLMVCLIAALLTEFTSNSATAQVLLPIVGTLAIGLRLHPLLLMIPTTFACSFAFMLPVATPPNAIVFGTRRLTVPTMVHVGGILILVCAIALTAAILTLGRLVFGIDLAEFPAWAAP